MSDRIGRPPYPDVLTPAEWRVLEQLREGKPNAEIAVRLGISINTVRYHVSNMLAKLDQPDRHARAAWNGRPKRRFAWLPSLPPLPVAIEGAARWIVGSAVAAAAIVAAVFLLTGSDEPAPAPSVAVYTDVFVSELAQLVAIDPQTGAPVAGADWGEFNAVPGGFLRADGSLLWYRSPFTDDNPRLVIADGAHYGFPSSGLEAHSDGIVHERQLPVDAEQTVSLIPHPYSDDRTVLAIRGTSGSERTSLSWLDLASGDEDPIGELASPTFAIFTTGGRIFALTRRETVIPWPHADEEPDLDSYLRQLEVDAVVELDPTDASELARTPVEGAVFGGVLFPDNSTTSFSGLRSEGGSRFYMFDPRESEMIVVDLGDLSVERRALPPRIPGLGPPGRLSPDGTRLYTSGDDILGCFLSGDSCFPEPLGFHVIDIASGAVLYEVPGANRHAMSPDGRWLLTAQRTYERAGIIGDGLRLIDADSLTEVAHLQPSEAFESLAFSADGRYAYATRPGANADRAGGCSSDCTDVLVIDVERRRVINTHTYDRIVRLYPVETP